MTPIQQQRAAAFDRFEAQDARLRNFNLYDTEFIGWVEHEHREHKQRGRRVIFLAVLFVSVFVFMHMLWSGPVQGHIEAEVWADE